MPGQSPTEPEAKAEAEAEAETSAKEEEEGRGELENSCGISLVFGGGEEEGRWVTPGDRTS